MGTIQLLGCCYWSERTKIYCDLNADLLVTDVNPAGIYFGISLPRLLSKIGRLFLDHSGNRKTGTETAAVTHFAFYYQSTVMPGEHMLGDRQAQTRAASFARTAAVNAVEAFGQTRNMLSFNSIAPVPYAKA